MTASNSSVISIGTATTFGDNEPVSLVDASPIKNEEIDVVKEEGAVGFTPREFGNATQNHYATATFGARSIFGDNNRVATRLSQAFDSQASVRAKSGRFEPEPIKKEEVDAKDESKTDIKKFE